MLYIARYKDNKIEVTEHEIMSETDDCINYYLEANRITHVRKEYLDKKNTMFVNEIRSLDKDKAIELLIEMLDGRIESLIEEVENVSNAIMNYGRD